MTKDQMFFDFCNLPRNKSWFEIRPHMLHLYRHVFEQLCEIYEPDKINREFVRSQNKQTPHLLFNINAKSQETANDPESPLGNAIWIKPRFNTSKLTGQYLLHVTIAVSYREHQHHFISFHNGMIKLVTAIKKYQFKNIIYKSAFSGNEFIECKTGTIPTQDKELILNLKQSVPDSYSIFPRREAEYRRSIYQIEQENIITRVLALPKYCVASHIKPFADCLTFEEAHDKYNGLWLEKRMDQLFDKGYVTFKDCGTVVIGTKCTDNLLKHLKLARNEIHDVAPLLQKQAYYMSYHRKHVFKA